jgi:hypothetical protein
MTMAILTRLKPRLSPYHKELIVVRKALADLLKKPAGELATEDLEMLAAEKRKQAEKELQKTRGKLQARIDRLSGQLEEVQKELAALPKPEEPSRRRRKATKPRKLKKTAAGSITTLATAVLFKSDKPHMTLDEIFKAVKGRMKTRAKNPRQALSATLSTTDRFESVGRGKYRLTKQARAQLEAEGKKK